MTSNDPKVLSMRSGVLSGVINFGLEKSLAPKNAQNLVILDQRLQYANEIIGHFQCL